MIIPEGMSFGVILLNEIGLEIVSGRLVDQDSRLAVLLPFSPKFNTIQDVNNLQNNPKIMNALFMYFCDKIKVEQNIYIDVVYYKQIKNSRNLPLAVKANGKEFISKIYNSESLKYLDLICQLNGGTDVDLSRFDIQNDT